MKYANAISDIINAFLPEPLKSEQMDQFYCNDTMQYRMSDKYRKQRRMKEANSLYQKVYDLTDQESPHFNCEALIRDNIS